VFTAARTLTNPAVSIVSAVDSVDKPRAARALAIGGMAGLRQAVGRTRLFLVVVTGAYLGLVACAAQPLLDLAFHHRYSGITLEVRVLAAAIFLFCLNQPSETMLIMLRASATMFATRSATAVLTVGLLIAGSGAGVTGMALGIALAQAANLVFLMVGAHLAERRQAMQWALA
jgi:O-antigen/teichoic acid export membrane protein